MGLHNHSCPVVAEAVYPRLVAILNVVECNILLGIPFGLLRNGMKWGGPGSVLKWSCWGLAVVYIVLAAPYLLHYAARPIGHAVRLRDPEAESGRVADR